ncbi:MAG TPA: M48 family metallopeptidase [Chryseolinea sp.]
MPPRLHLLQWSLLLIGCLIVLDSHAQLTETFKPVPTYNETETRLVQDLRRQLNDELRRMGARNTAGVSSLYSRNTKYLVSLVKAKRIVNDAEMQGFVDTIFNELKAHTELHTTPQRVLIAKLPSSNATCMGEGTFLLTTGLLGRIENESQLAFTLAHEIAHYELGHIQESIEKMARGKYERKVKQGMTKVLTSDNADESDVDSVRKIVYDMTRFGRVHEREADSLGLIIARQAGYNTGESIAMLSVLDSLDYTKHKLGYALFDEFQFTKYPFQERWLKPRLSLYSNRRDNVLFFSRDSLRTHPDITQRQQWLREKLTTDDSPFNKRPTLYVDEIISLAQFEDLSVAYKFQRFDYAMLMALQLKVVYPQNTYLTAVISKIFIDLYTIKGLYNDQTFRWGYVSYYGDELKLINAFQYNLSQEEVGEVAFNFLNNQNNFNATNPEHYYLLWKICELTKRETVQARIKDSFVKNFDKAKNRYYYDLMR